MNTRALVLLGAGFCALSAAGNAVAEVQQVSGVPSSQVADSGEAASVTAQYNVDNGDNTLTGFGLRIHWDSTKLTFVNLTGVYTTGIAGQDSSCQTDASNFDGDPNTDCFVNLAWFDLGGNWPNAPLPLDVAIANFTSNLAAGESTSVNFSSSSTAVGYTFAGTPAEITANAGPATFEATVTPPANGSIEVSPPGDSCGADCRSYPAGTEVTFTAVPDTGFAFSAWGGACAGTSGTVCTLTMSSDVSVSATFAELPPPADFEATITPPANGSIEVSPPGDSCGADCRSYPAGTEVTFTAVPDTGFAFSAWGGACAGTSGTVCTLSPTSDVTVSATFAEEPPPPTGFEVTLTPPANGQIEADPPGEPCGPNCTRYATGTEVTLTAVPDSGFQFSRWTGACAGTSSPACQLTLAANVAVSAVFARIPSPQGIPTMSVWGLAMLSGVLGLIGAWARRKKR